MRALLALAWLTLALSEPRVWIRRPSHAEVVAEDVVIEVEISGLNVPRDGWAEVHVNGVRAFESRQERASVVVPSFEPGFHEVSAHLVNAEERLEGEGDSVHFLFDPPDRTPRHDVGSLGYGHMEKGRVSVIIASHDRYDTLIQSVASVRAQTYEDVEIVIVNDASSDMRYYDLIEDVMLIHLPYNIGRPGLVRNVGVAASSGEYVAFLDDDDVWMPDKLQVQLEAMQERGANMSCSDALAGRGAYVTQTVYPWWLRDLHGPYAVRNAVKSMVAFAGGYDTSKAIARGECFEEQNCLPDMWDAGLLMRANFVITSSAVVKREALMRAGPFNSKTLGEDHDLWKLVVRGTPCAFVRRPLVYWRVDGTDKVSQKWQQ